MEINEYLIKCFQLMRNMENIDFFAGAHELSRTEFRLLREVILEEERGKSIISSELARRLGITRSAVSQIVTKMEKDGVVVRVASPTDRKIAYIRLSDSARVVFEEQCKEANATMERIVSEVGEDKVKEFFRLYDDLNHSIEKVMKEIKGEKEGAQN